MKPVHSLCGLLPLVAIATASPLKGDAIFTRSAPRRPKRSPSTTRQFDNRVALPEGTAQENAAGIFGALDYSSFSLASATASILIPPPTEPNYIYASPIDEEAEGEHQYLPANSSVKYFNLEALSYACAIETGLVPSSCTIQLAGVRAPQFGGGTVIANLVFNYVVTAGVVAAYANATFTTMTGLVSVTVNIISESAADTADLVLFDGVRYVAYIES